MVNIKYEQFNMERVVKSQVTGMIFFKSLTELTNTCTKERMKNKTHQNKTEYKINTPE